MNLCTSRMMRGMAALTAGSLATTASGEVLFSFGFTDLGGSFDSATNEFRAEAVSKANYQTTGDVTRQGGQTARFGTDFVSTPTDADFEVVIEVLNIIGNEADGQGTFTIIDDDGDTITGMLDGDFSSPGLGIIFFNGLLSNVTLTDNGALDGTFDGPSGGAFDMNFAQPAPYEGALIQLFFSPTGGFFDDDFSNEPVQFDGEVVPAPGAGALVLLSAGCIASRRRPR